MTILFVLYSDKTISVWHLLAALITLSGLNPSKAMEQYKVVPDVIPEVPAEVLQVRFGSIDLQPGDELTPTQVKDTPTVSWKAEKDALYTLLCTDVDIPATYGFKAFAHWLVVNIPGTDVTSGKTIFEHFGSGAPEGTGLHRYIYLLYKQSGTLNNTVTDAIKDEKMTDRGTFTMENFVKENNLVGPVAANFYRAQYDDYVPQLHALLQKKYGS